MAAVARMVGCGLVEAWLLAEWLRGGGVRRLVCDCSFRAQPFVQGERVGCRLPGQVPNARGVRGSVLPILLGIGYGEYSATKQHTGCLSKSLTSPVHGPASVLQSAGIGSTEPSSW